ncbi:GcrA cell cycle regulator [compost metagenome]
MATSVWTDDLVDRLKVLWKEGRSAAQVARTLRNGLTRSAVLGKVHRMGLSEGRLSPPKAKPRVKPVSRSGAGVGYRPRTAPEIQKAGPRPILTVAAPSYGTATILSVRRLDCRWPYGEPQDTGFALCGRKVSRGAFCAAHAAMGYRANAETPDSLLRMVVRL